MSAPLIACEGLACLRGDRLLWRGVSLRIGSGEALHVTGANGIGKSSLIRILAGLLPPAAGTVERSGRTALVDEAHALDRELSVARALLFWAGIDERPAEAIPAALNRLGIAHLHDVPVRFLSTGQRKRAALARLLVSEAPLWLLDEPGNGLDRDGLTLLEGLIAEHRAGGGAVLLASHLPLAMTGSSGMDLAEHRP